jgi:hypothetical protein
MYGFLTNTMRDYILEKRKVNPHYRKILNYRIREAFYYALSDFRFDFELVEAWFKKTGYLVNIKDLPFKKVYEFLDFYKKWGRKVEKKKHLPSGVYVPMKCPYCGKVWNEYFFRSKEGVTARGRFFGVDRKANTEA